MSSSLKTSSPLKVDRRFVIGGGAALTGALVLSPLAAAQRGAEPTGQTAIVDLSGSSAVDVSILQPGEMVVVATGGTYYGILRRTSAQIAAARASDGGGRDPIADSQRVVSAGYLVVDMACPHRGCQVGYQNNADEPFACPCHRSNFDASGRVLGGPARSNLAVPPHRWNGAVVTFT